MTDRHGTITLDCACCGVAIAVGATVSEDDEYTCKGCSATCKVFFEDDTSDAHMYFGAWCCRHGIDGDDPCDQCETEHGVAV